MKTAAIKSLIYKDFYMARKTILIQMTSFIIFAVMGILVEVSFRIGNLALLPDHFKSEIKEMADLSVVVYPIFVACILTHTISDASLKDENAAWKRFCYSSPVSYVDLALAKYIAFFITIVIEGVISFCYVAVICHIMDVRLSKIYLSCILIVITVTILMAVLNHIGILLFHTKDKAGFFMFAVLIGIMIIATVINMNFGKTEITKEVLEKAAIYILPWLPALISGIWLSGAMVSAMLLKRREK